ncbi:phosphotransferase family protein [Streptomyces sp. NPDC096310]|uniref:phosphotransferase family protein n=1 Tax=Streptomyces sp. NPDC096310 TaxID=3366082 RepID=UPI0038203D0A
MTASVVHALGHLAHEAAHPTPDAPTTPCHAGSADPACPICHICHICHQSPTVLADRPDGTVVRHGRAVAKAHADGTDPAGHRARLAVAAHPRLAGILLPPLLTPTEEVYGRPVTAWPYGDPVDPVDPDAAPWEQAGTLIARLHRVPPAALTGPPPAPPTGPVPGGLPAMRGPAKAARALARLSAAGPHPAAVPVRRAWERLPAWARGEAPQPGPYALCHGDLHLGQLVRHPAPDGPWVLIDVDDLGLGAPAWDLARPAAWYATGLLPPEPWQRFLGAYRAARGPAVPADPAADPWPYLDVAARALTVQTAALAVVKSLAEDRELDEVELLTIDACDRIAGLATELESKASS